MGKTVAYIRVSTEDQEAQGTLENQRHAISAFALSRGVEIAEWLEETQSGVDLDRAEFNRLAQGVSAGNYSTVIVAAQDRLSRSPLQTLQFIETIQEGKANLYIIRENIAINGGRADFASEMLIHMISVFAKNERETIKTRTMAGKLRKQRSGKWVTGQAPLGYELDRQTKILKINGAEADIVRLIFDLRLKGSGVLKIIKQLNSSRNPLYERRYEFKRSRYCKVSEKQKRAGYCRVRHFHQDYQECPECVREYGGMEVTGTSWSTTLIKKVLKNRVYLGQIRIEENWHAAAHEAIVDEATFDRVQDILTKEYRHPYQSYPPNLLSGLIYCGCGRRMHVTSAKRRTSDTGRTRGLGYWAFTCPSRKVGQCDQKNVPVMRVRKEVFRVMDSIMQSEKTAQVVKEAYQRVLRDREMASPDVEELKKEFHEVSEQLRRLSRSYTQASLRGVKEETLTELIEEITVTEERKEHLGLQIKFLESQRSALKAELRSMSDEEVLSQAFSLWQIFSRGVVKPIGKPGKHHQIAGQVIRAFLSRVEVRQQEIVPVTRFDEELLERPFDELLRAVLKVRELGSFLPTQDAGREDTTFS